MKDFDLKIYCHSVRLRLTITVRCVALMHFYYMLLLIVTGHPFPPQISRLQPVHALLLLSLLHLSLGQVLYIFS